MVSFRGARLGERAGVVTVALDRASAGLPAGALLELSPEPGFVYTLRISRPRNTPVTLNAVRADGTRGQALGGAGLRPRWRAAGLGQIRGYLELDLQPLALDRLGSVCLCVGQTALQLLPRPPARYRVSFCCGLGHCSRPEIVAIPRTSTWALGAVEIRRAPERGALSSGAARLGGLERAVCSSAG